VHVADLDHIGMFAREFPVKGKALAKIFWPGPMTLILIKQPAVPPVVTAGLDTVAIRIPRHPVTLALLKEFDGGLVGPSANTSGKPSPTNAMHVRHDLDGKIDMILDAGQTAIGVESTVIDVTVEPPMILRFGGISREEIESAIGSVQLAVRADSLRRSPGTRHRHYAPAARVILFPPGDGERCAALCREWTKEAKSIVVLSHTPGFEVTEPGIEHRPCGPTGEAYAHRLFSEFRALDERNTEVLLVEEIEEQGIGAAVMDRLRKAAHYSGTTEK
jgi:L-threonylcarbamoyladenylate synthase